MKEPDSDDVADLAGSQATKFFEFFMKTYLEPEVNERIATGAWDANEGIYLAQVLFRVGQPHQDDELHPPCNPVRCSDA